MQTSARKTAAKKIVTAIRKKTAVMKTAQVASSALRGDESFDVLATAVKYTFASHQGPIFKVSTHGLFTAYLAAFDPATRQVHNCHCCHRFIEQFGGLVSIDASGKTRSLIWPVANVPLEYAASVAAVRAEVERRAVTGVFLSSTPVMGTPETAPWHHFAVHGRTEVFALATASQVEAMKRDDHDMILRALGEFSLTVAEQAFAITESETLYRSEKVSGVAKWFVELHKSLVGVKSQDTRYNIMWRAAATAPAGFAHVRSSMIGTLLEDIAAGLSLDDIKRKFAAKMHPLQYQRPTAPPSDGNIAVVEAIIAKLNAAGALARRFARLDDLQTLWLPKETVAVKQGGVFGHLRGGGTPATPVAGGGVTTMTWEKFARTILPTAERIAYQTPSGYVTAAFCALVTAVDAAAPILFQWPNHVSWYFYHGGSTAASWNLPGGAWVDVTAVARHPSKWSGDYPQHSDGVVLTLRDCRDLKSDTEGAAIFPETLKSEYHEIRRTVEAYSRSARIAGRDEASACGIGISKSDNGDATLRVTSRGTVIDYRIDRWD